LADPAEVDHRDDASHHHRELDEAVLVQLAARKRRVGRPEHHRLGFDLFDAAARADRLIVESDAGLFLVGIRPFGVDRIRKGRARSGNIDG
jgi:hypothetical protein